MTAEQIKNAIISITPEYPIKRAILFGSRADGTNHENSDIDIAIMIAKLDTKKGILSFPGLLIWI